MMFQPIIAHDIQSIFKIFFTSVQIVVIDQKSSLTIWWYLRDQLREPTASTYSTIMLTKTSD